MKTICFLIVMTALILPYQAIESHSADISPALANTFGHEGGFQRDPGDSGNFWNGTNYGTKYGICAKSYGAYFAKQGKQIKDITLADAAKVYGSDFWGASRCNDWKSQSVAETFFEVSVNAGQGSAARLIQRAANIANWPKDPIPVDGNIGSATVKRINEANQELLYFHFMGLVYGHYQKLVLVRHEKRQYVRTWALRGSKNVRDVVMRYEAKKRAK